MVGLQPNEIASTLNDAWELFGHNTEDFYDMFLANLPRDVELMANTIDRAYHPMGCDIFHIIVKVPLDYYSKESYIAHITGIQDTCWNCHEYIPDTRRVSGTLKSSEVMAQSSFILNSEVLDTLEKKTDLK